MKNLIKQDKELHEYFISTQLVKNAAELLDTKEKEPPTPSKNLTTTLYEKEGLLTLLNALVDAGLDVDNKEKLIEVLIRLEDTALSYEGPDTFVDAYERLALLSRELIWRFDAQSSSSGEKKTLLSPSEITALTSEYDELSKQAKQRKEAAARAEQERIESLQKTAWLQLRNDRLRKELHQQEEEESEAKAEN